MKKKIFKRICDKVIKDHLSKERQMIFLVGPRQVGKTTTSHYVSSAIPKHFYFNWDVQTNRAKIIQGPDAVAEALGLNGFNKRLRIVVIFDEIHKYSKWKTFLKGFFDKYSSQIKIIVTGSARLDVYKAGGDSLMGRYFLYRLHPLSVAELLQSKLRQTEISASSKPISDKQFDQLFEFGGFPEPFLKHSKLFSTRWKRLRTQQLFQEDIRDLTKINDLGQMEVLAELLRYQVGQQVNYSSLAVKINTSVDTIKRWIKVLKSFYFCFTLQPWTKNLTRSLLKEPKVYLWDWADVKDTGAKVENFIASHLLKAVHFWTDQGLGEYHLYYLRDKEKREVDFLVSKDGEPWFIVEAKTSDHGSLSKSLFYYQKQLKIPHAFQVVFDMPYEKGNCFDFREPIIVPAKTFLSQLV